VTDKTIRITWSYDQAATQKVKQGVKEITDSVEKLKKASSGISIGTGKTLPGLNNGGKPLINSILGSNSEIGSVTQKTQEAFRSISSSIKTFSDRALNDINKLVAAVGKLNGSLSTTSGITRGKTIPGVGPQASAADLNPGAAGIRGDEWKGGSPVHRGLGAMDKLRGAESGFKQWVGGRVAAGAQFAGIPAPMAQRLGGVAARFAIPAAIGVAAVGAYEFSSRAFEGERAAQIGFSQSEPLRQLQRSAAVAQIGRQTYLATRSGRISYLAAQQEAFRNKSLMSAIGNAPVQREAIELALGHGPSLGGLKTQALERIRGYAGRKFGQIMEAFGNELPGGVDQRAAFQLKLQQAMMDTNPELASQFQAAVDANMMRQDPRLQMLRDESYQGALSNTASMRAAGISAGSVGYLRTRRVAGGTISTDPYDAQRMMEARLLRSGFTTSDYAGGYQHMLGVGKGYLGQLGPITMLRAQLAGVHSGSAVVRAGGMLGGSVGAGGDMFRRLQSSVGRGGLDVAVGNQFFGSESQRLLGTGQFSGGAAANYLSMMSGLIGGGAGAPLDVAEQQRRMMLLDLGNSSMAGFGGSLAPLYQATSLFGSASAAGGFGDASEALKRMSPEQLLSISRGGEVPLWASSQGVTASAVQKYLAYQRKSPFFAVVDERATGQAKSVLGRFRASGSDFLNFANTETQGMRSGAAARRASELAATLGGVLFSQGLAASPDAGAGTLMQQLGASAKFAPYLSGGGAWAPGPSGIVRTALEDQAGAKKEEARTLGQNQALLGRQFNTAGAREAGILGVKSTSVAASMEESVGQVSSQLNLLAANIRKLNESFPKITKAR